MPVRAITLDTKSVTYNCILLVLKETNAAFMWCHVAFFSGFWLARRFGGADAAPSGKYLTPRCTRTERQCLVLFVPGAPVFWPPTNGSLWAAMYHSLATKLRPSRAVPLIGFGVNKSENEAIHGRCWHKQDTEYLTMSSLMMVYRVAPYQHLFKRDWGQSSPNTYCNILPSLALKAPGYFTAKLEGRSGDWTGEEWFVIMFGGEGSGGGGWRPAAHTDVWNQLGMDHRPVRQRVGRRGRKSVAWEERGWKGGRKGGSQWKNCENALA